MTTSTLPPLLSRTVPAVPFVNTTVAAMLETTAALLKNGGLHIDPGELRLALELAVPASNPDPTDRAELAAMGLGGYLRQQHPRILSYEDTTARGVFKLSLFCSRDWLILQLIKAAEWHRSLAAKRTVA